MNDGIYYNLERSAYDGIDRLNISHLLWMGVSPMHFQAIREGRMHIDSTALAFGRAVHARILEPEVYQREFVIGKPCEQVLKTGPRAGQICGKPGQVRHRVNLPPPINQDHWLCGVHAPGQDPEPNLLGFDEAQRIERMANAVAQHEVYNVLSSRGGMEATVLGTVEQSEAHIPVKLRLDKYIVKTDIRPSVIVDIKKKTAGEAGDYQFSKSVAKYKYHTRAAWYVDITEAVTGDRPAFIWVVIEDDEPYGVNVIQADNHTLSTGRQEYQKLLSQYVSCLKSEKWPGYCTKIHMGGLPTWYTSP